GRHGAVALLTDPDVAAGNGDGDGGGDEPVRSVQDPPPPDLPEEQRADAVSSMVYEAAARARDPVYGSAGAICQLQRQVDGLKAQLARAQAELAAARAHHAHLVALLCVEVATAAAAPPQDAYCAAGGGSQSQLAAPPGVGSTPADALYVVDGSAVGGGGIMQAGHVGWADEPLWT
uniref:LOB domain-containing protein n=1 Tax=Aegilops tauschii subsp. strangulata TaxID=200361 RepID=A0A452XT87_AEGTS